MQLSEKVRKEGKGGEISKLDVRYISDKTVWNFSNRTEIPVRMAHTGEDTGRGYAKRGDYEIEYLHAKFCFSRIYFNPTSQVMRASTGKTFPTMTPSNHFPLFFLRIPLRFLFSLLLQEPWCNEE